MFESEGEAVDLAGSRVGWSGDKVDQYRQIKKEYREGKIPKNDWKALEEGGKAT